jgi:transcriptional regulator with XRE-family HTH domain
MSSYHFDAARLRDLRRAKGLSPTELASQLGRSYPSVLKYEAGAVVPPTATVVAIASVLGCEPGDLFAEAVAS